MALFLIAYLWWFAIVAIVAAVAFAGFWIHDTWRDHDARHRIQRLEARQTEINDLEELWLA